MNETKDKIELNWTDLTPIKNIKNTINPNRGVYCWGFKKNNQFMPYYIGIAENITYRIYEHLNAIIGGKYTLFHKDSLFSFAIHKDEKVTNLKKGKVYIPDWPKDYENFIKNRDNLKGHIDYMIDHFTYSYATVNEIDFTKNDLGEIEKICIEQIGKENLINTRGGKSNRFEIMNLGDENLTKFFNKNLN